ncbi:PhoU domain-containing protein [Natronorubrum sp. DTA7]|uniref:PhoU domain-containing protein n=1 Tax=Natronorubrum sp. DTA7 TaxID=3447016 RepID=UPI003F82A434
METRKVQLTGGTTFTVSLPKAWATEQGIDPGSILYLYPHDDGSLLLESEAETTTGDRTTTIDLRSVDETSVRQTIHALYVSGFDSITFVDTTGAASDYQSTVSDAVSSLIGFEIMEATSDRIQVDNLTDADSVSIRKSTLRLRLIAFSMHRDAITAVVDGDRDLATQIVDRDNEVDKLLALVSRYFQRTLTNLQEIEQLGTTRTQLFDYYYVARQLERVADHAEKIAARVHDDPPDIPASLEDEFTALGTQSRRLVERASDAILMDSHVSDAYDALETRDAIVHRVNQLGRELYEVETPDAHDLGLILDSLRRTADYGGNIAEAAIRRCASTGTLPNQRFPTN